MKSLNSDSVTHAWRVPLIDPSLTYGHLEPELIAAFERVLRSGRFILGHEVESFEALVATRLDSAHAVAVSSGTDALLCALMALNIGPGDEVITSPLTFIASAEAIVRVGAKPVFADVCPRCLCLDPMSVAAAMGPATRAVLPVHLYGDLGHIDELAALTRKHGLYLIEDACQAFGSKIGGRWSGTFGTIGCFSFFPTKTLGGLGDAGLICTQDDDVATRLRSLRSHGRSDKHAFSLLGGNFRMDALHAALLGVLMRDLDAWLASRQSIARCYTSGLETLPTIRTPQSCSNCESAWNAYTIRSSHARDGLVRYLNGAGIEVGVYYPKILSDQLSIARSSRCCQGLDNARCAAQQVCSVPIHPGLTPEAQSWVVHSIREYFCADQQRLANA